MIKSDRFAIVCETKSCAVIFLLLGVIFESPRIMKVQTKVCIFIITFFKSQIARNKKMSHLSLIQNNEVFKNDKISQLISVKRKEKGFSINELAQYANIENSKDLESYELGLKSIPLTDLYAIANILNIRPSEILKLINL